MATNTSKIKEKKVSGKLIGFVVSCLSFLIFIYQLAISPFLGPRCRFEPSCSNYAREALNVHGIVGFKFIVLRLLRCQPFCKNGWDPVPAAKPRDTPNHD